MKILGLTIDEKTTNLIFSKNYPSLIFHNKIFYRDDKNIANVKLKEKLKSEGFTCITKKNFIKNKNKVHFEFHFHSNIKALIEDSIKYCILPESELIDRLCNKELLKKKYHKVFTNIKNDIDNKTFFYLNWPFKISQYGNFKKKKRLICMIASNKNLIKNSNKSGYQIRVKIVNWFKKNKIKDFHLYGEGWNRFFSSNYYINRFLSFLSLRFNLFIPQKNICYKGIVKKKFYILQKYKFTICIENVLNERGYNTGQIIDALKCYSIPIYYGRPDLDKAIPKNCYIDMRSFKDFNEMYSFINTMSEKKYMSYIRNIKNYLRLSNKKEFDINAYILTIIKHLKKDEKKLKKY